MQQKIRHLTFKTFLRYVVDISFRRTKDNGDFQRLACLASKLKRLHKLGKSHVLAVHKEVHKNESAFTHD